MTSTNTTAWSTVIDVSVQRDPTEGTYSVTVHNADTSEAATYPIDAVTNRAALLETTALIKEKGWVPNAYWYDSDDKNVVATRRFRKAAS